MYFTSKESLTTKHDSLDWGRSSILRGWAEGDGIARLKVRWAIPDGCTTRLVIGVGIRVWAIVLEVAVVSHAYDVGGKHMV